MANIHEVIDHDNHFIIDPITRKINPETPEKNELVQFDHNSERYTFEIPRCVDGHDMSLCTAIQIHYINVSADKRQTKSDIYEVDDLGVMAEKDDVVAFTWLISQNATQLVGTLNFAIRFTCATADSIDYRWNTKVHSGISVSNGLNNEQIVVEDYSDILEQWRSELFEGNTSAIAVVQELRAEVEAVNQVVSDSNLNSTIQYTFSVTDPSADTSMDVELTADETLEITNTAKTLAGLKNPNTAIIAFATDLHIRSGRTSTDTEYVLSAGSATKIKKTIAAYNKIATEVEPDMLIFGGDYLDNNSTTVGDGAKCALSVLRGLIGNCSNIAPIAVLKGNHDDNTMNTDYVNNWVNDDELWSLILNVDKKKTVRNAGHNEKGYGYYDIPNQKIRVFYLNTIDIPQVLDTENNTLNYKGQWTTGFSSEQLQFVADNLQFTEEGWHVIFFSHHPLLYSITIESGCGVSGPHGGDGMLSIINAFTKNQSGTYTTTATDFESVINYNFTKNVDCRVIACVNGHTHRDSVDKLDDINMISTRAVAGHPSYSDHVSAFCYFVIDRNKCKLDMIYNGDGTDTSFLYDTTDEPIDTPEKPITFDFGWTIGEVNKSTGVPTSDSQNMRIINDNLFGNDTEAIIHFSNTDSYRYNVYWFDKDGTYLPEEWVDSWMNEPTLTVPNNRLIRLKVREKSYQTWDDARIATFNSTITITAKAATPT